ncbi:hypothetical protein Amn_pb00640 (plasmid) [Aminobacter sp. Y103A]|uniref:antitoxin Xre/MbcA/ParS-like domain-containing protein n=1 Tax=Aminobacter sp. Y103A TaxID=1870862 RepID=UPI002574757C|nr:hypothetical protein [Aminobacter sp. SS-2016]BBD41073.1 hypothetical protein Amn_pb00640 [Aminobacter sp. SS-2016]
MNVDIQLQGMTTGRYAEIISIEIRKVFSGDDVRICDGLISAAGKLAAEVSAALTCLSPSDLRAIGDMRSEMAELAAQFVRAVASEASGQCLPDAAGAPAGKPEALTFLSPGPGEHRGDLESMVLEDWAGRVAGATYLHEKMRIPRSTLHRWYRRKEVVALRKGPQRHVFPLAQFVDGRPASGIREVLNHIEYPRLAWFWLVQPSSLLEGRAPIQLLRQDMVSDVVSAARDYSKSL